MVVVFGSINLDLVARVPRFPRPGETLAGESFATCPGGKGANQALAAARAGAHVGLVGAVGNDAFAAPALALLRAGGVDLSRVRTVDAPTGVAMIHVAASGENAIAVVAGANALADPDDVPAEWLAPATILVLQQEVPAAANAALAKRARAHGAKIVLNAAPARPLSRDALGTLDVLIVNEMEMLALAGEHGLPHAPVRFAQAFAQRHGGICVVTQGAEGAVAAAPGVCCRLHAPPVAVVDTTGAGDAFVGAFAAARDGGGDLRAALCRGVAAGTLACARRGAQTALPDAGEVAPLVAALETRIVAVG